MIAACGKLAEFNEGALPDALNVNSLHPGVQGHRNEDRQRESAIAAIQQKVMDEMTPIGRGLSFLALLTDAHYAGKGVKLNEKDRPILWYPAGAAKYRVIDASLAVTEIDAKDLPKADSVPVRATTAPASK